MRVISRVKAIPTGMPVEVQRAVTAEDLPDDSSLARWAQAVTARLEATGDCDPDVCLRLVATAESASLNAAYRGKDKPTNVLSFTADVEVPEVSLLGDLVICADVVRDEARAQHKLLSEHFAHMVVHGMLHLYGYDHVDQGQAEVMEDLEREILGQFGISDPYAAR